MKKVIYIIISCLFVLGFNVYASDDSIKLNTPLTDDVAHTFQYPEFEIDDSIKPYSLTLSIEDGYFSANNSENNASVLTYFKFKGGTNIANAYTSTLNTTDKYKVITFNLKDIDISLEDIKANVISSIKNFMRNIVFYNEENKDAKFTLTFSEVELKFSDTTTGLSNLDVIAFKDPNQAKEHYYMKIEEDAITWSDAYNIASGLKWNNLQGYLTTITSEEEHNFIYKSLGSIRGWMGSALIANIDDINFNEKNNTWIDASDLLEYSESFGYSEENDNKIKDYWYWVAGPEAGQKVFKDGDYTNFTPGEPNNFDTGEAYGEYGHGDSGAWNDYPDYYYDIQGYYVEFGGFDDDNETVKPVSLVNTFKWKDYDIRNIETNIEEQFEDVEFNQNVTEEEIKEVIDEAIEEAGITETTYNIKSKSVEGTTLTIEIEVIIGEGTNQVKYDLTITKEIEIEEPEPEENPSTGDNIIMYVITSLLSLVTITYIGYNLKNKVE